MGRRVFLFDMFHAPCDDRPGHYWGRDRSSRRFGYRAPAVWPRLWPHPVL